MAGLAQLAMGTAPIAGGALLTLVAGKFKTQAPDYRALIKDDQDLLKGIQILSRDVPNCSAPSTCGSTTSSRR